MSDFPEGADWWKARNGLWYPPPATDNGDPPEVDLSPAAVARRAAEAQSGQKMPAGCLVALLAVGALFVIMVISSIGGDGGPSGSDGPTLAGAEDVCRQAVKDKLKAPATADIEVQGHSGSGSVYRLTGVVDSENGFGAKLRSSWACTATHVSGTSWRATALVG